MQKHQCKSITMTPEQLKNIKDCVRKIVILEKAIQLNKLELAITLIDQLRFDLGLLNEERKQRRHE